LVINHRLRTQELQAALYADELWDTTGDILRIVTRSWRDPGRADRAEALEAIADQHARRATP
jgi:hypothetical protein